MRTVLSYYKFQNNNHPIFLVIDNDLASQLRAGSFGEKGRYDVSSINDAKNVIANLISEDIFTTAYPVANSSKITGLVAQDLEEFIPNYYFVEQTGNFTDGTSEVGDLTLRVAQDSSSATAAAKVNLSPLNPGNYNGYTPYSVGVNISTSGSSGNYYYIEIFFFVFTEEEYNDGNFSFTDTTNKHTMCWVHYFRPSASATSQHRVEWGTYQPSGSNADVYGRMLFNNFAPPTPPAPTPSGDDPYDPSGDGSGYSGSGGGPAGTGGTGATGTGGLHDDTSDPIPIPIPPTDIITSAGLITAYNPSTSQLVAFANKLWNGDPDTIGDWFRLLFGGDAFNAIIGIHLLPVTPATSSAVNIKLGNWDTGAVAPKIINQYVQHTFGTIMLPEYWGNCIDYAPYTKIQLALPYIGIVDVDTDDVLGSENTLTYNIDVYSGALCAMLRCVKGNLSSVIYQWSGSCGVGIPITGADKSAILGTVVAGSAITGAAGAIGGPVGAVAANAALAGTAASSYGTMKGKVQKQGNFSPNSGAMGIMAPYFILTRPVQSVPTSWQADKGYPANISAQLGTLTGYTEVSEINLECSGTEAEKKEIIDLLKKGVLF